jgi:predicted transcriptional regulator
MNEQVAEIVAAYLRHNTVAATDVPGVITQVYQSLAGLGQPPVEQFETGVLKPAVPVRRSVTDDARHLPRMRLQSEDAPAAPD